MIVISIIEYNYSSLYQLCFHPHNNISLAHALLLAFPCLNLIKSAWDRVANITDFSVEVRNSENDPRFYRYLYGVLKFPNFLRNLQFFDHFLTVIGNHHSCGALA